MNDTDARQIYDMVYQYVATPISVLGFLGNFLILFVWCREAYHPTYYILVILSVGRNLYAIVSHLCHFLGQRPCYQQDSILHFVVFCLQFFVATGSLFMTVVHYFWMFHVQQSKVLTSRFIGVVMVVLVLWSIILTALPHLAKNTDMKVEIYFSLMGVALPAICQCALSIVMSCKYHVLCRLQTDSSRFWSSDTDWWRMNVAMLEGAREVQTRKTSLTHLSSRKTSSAMPNRRAPFTIPIPPMLRDQPLEQFYSSTQRQSFSITKRRRSSGLPMVDTRTYSIGSASKRFQPPIAESRARSSGTGARSLTSGVRASSIGTPPSFTRERAHQLSSVIVRLTISKAVIVISFFPFFLHCISLLGYVAVFFLPGTSSVRPKRYLFRAAFITGLYIDNTYQGFFFLFLFKSFQKPFRHLFYCWNRNRKSSTRVGIEDSSAPSKENSLISKVEETAGRRKGKVKAGSSVPLTGNSTTFVGSKSSGDSADRSSELSSSQCTLKSDSSDDASSIWSSGSSAS